MAPRRLRCVAAWRSIQRIEYMVMPSNERNGEDSQSELFELEGDATRADHKQRRKRAFFTTQEPHSAVKSIIASDYFGAWSKILTKVNPRVLYLDFFCGPGKFDDGSESTPLLVMKRILESPSLHDKAVTYFGDQDKDATARLQMHTDALPGIGELRFKPIIKPGVVTPALQAELAKMRLVPTLMFLDPFGYKVLNVDLISSIIHNHGSECLFFFNYNRVMPAISNPTVRHLVDAIFGPDRVDTLRAAFTSQDDAEKEAAVIGALRESMREIGGGYTLPFRFKKNGRTTHHLVFVSTHPLGHNIMKEIMGAHSSDHYQDVPSFEFREGPAATNIFDPDPRPIDDLKANLLVGFAGQSKTVKSIFDEHNLGTPYVLRNYKEAIKQLMREGAIPVGTRTIPDKPRLVEPFKTMPDDVLITFPP